MKNLKINYIITVVLLLVFILGTSGCIITLPEAEQPTTPAESTSSQAPVVPIDPGWQGSAFADSVQPLPSIADVVEQVFPSVVTITTEVVTLDIFQMPRTQSGAGSGWIFREDGIIVTNNHVVEGAEKVTVELSDGKTYQANPDKVFRDPVTDLAIVKINAKNLPVLHIADSTQLRVGEWVIALGNPLGQGIRAKEGTVSGVKVSLSLDEGQSLGDLIETSAAINPGNSGGPLVNMAGNVVGITSAKIAAVGVEGMGYAISTSTAMPIIDELINEGYIVRPYLGVGLYTVDQFVATVNRLPVDEGVILTYVEPGGPADKAGLQQYDIITQFNNQNVATAEELRKAIHSTQIGSNIKITYIRDSNTFTGSITPEESPAPGR
ncbi:MAG: trypsin-like peptidase domain-containing protein [Dehalococcoidia bacterium]